MRKSKKKLDLKKRNIFNGFDKIIFSSMFENFNLKFVYFPFYKFTYRNEHRFVNRCAFTGRPRGVLRRYKLSRGKLKEFIYSGYFSGVRRSS